MYFSSSGKKKDKVVSMQGWEGSVVQVLSQPRPHCSQWLLGACVIESLPRRPSPCWGQELASSGEGRQSQHDGWAGLRLAEGGRRSPSLPHIASSWGTCSQEPHSSSTGTGCPWQLLLMLVSLYGTFIPSRHPVCRTLSVPAENRQKISSPLSHNLVSVSFVSVNSG